MGEQLPVLQAGPTFEARQIVEPAPELGGSVIVRGLLASEAFALHALRAQATERVRAAAAEHRDLVQRLRAEYEQRCESLAPGVRRPEFSPPEFKAPALTFEELRLYGRYSCELLARAVVTPSGLGMYSADGWEVVAQHHRGLVVRLQQRAEELSGLDEGAVEKN